MKGNKKMMNKIKEFSFTVPYFLGIFLSILIYIYVFVVPQVAHTEATLNIIITGFIFFIILSSYFFNGNPRTYIIKQRSVFIVLFLTFMITFIGYGVSKLFIDDLYYYVFLSHNFHYLLLMILFSAFIDAKAINKMLVTVYVLYFAYALYFIPKHLEEKRLGIGTEINENTIGLFLVVFLTYLFVKLKHSKWWLIVCYVIGIFLLSLIKARASLVAFIILPLFFLILKLFKQRLRLFYSVYIFLSIIVLLVITFYFYPRNEAIDSIFSGRIALWYGYITNVWESQSFLFGTGYTILPSLSESLGMSANLSPHNQFITIFLFNGLVGLLLYILFLLISIPQKINEILPSDAIIFVIVTILFVESFIPFFDFYFLTFIFVVNLLINRSLHNDE